MILSVVNLQEAYAKALLVDRRRSRAHSARATCSAATGCCSTPTRTDVRPAVRQGPRRARRRCGSGRGAPWLGLCGAGPRERGSATAAGGWATMSTFPRIVEPTVERPGGPPATLRPATRSTRSCSPRTCSAPTARSSTSAAATRPSRGTAADHTGRESNGMWVKGSGSDLATMRRAGLRRAAARRDHAALRARRDERRGDGRLPRALPARPGDAAPLDRDALARVRPRCPRRPHPSGRDQLARRRARRRAAGRRVLRRTRPRGSPYIRPGFDAARSGRRARRGATRTASWSCSPSTASSRGATAPRRPTGPPIAVFNRAAAFVNAARDGAARSADPRARRALDDAERAARCFAESSRRCAARSPSEGSKVLRGRRSPAGRGVRRLARPHAARRRSAPPAPTTSSTRSGLPCGSRSTPTPTTRRRCRAADRRARSAASATLARLLRAPPRRRRRAG